MAEESVDAELLGQSAFHKLEHGFAIRDRLPDVLAEQPADTNLSTPFGSPSSMRSLTFSYIPNGRRFYTSNDPSASTTMLTNKKPRPTHSRPTRSLTTGSDANSPS